MTFLSALLANPAPKMYLRPCKEGNVGFPERNFRPCSESSYTDKQGVCKAKDMYRYKSVACLGRWLSTLGSAIV